MNQVKFAKIITEIFDLESKKEYLSILKLLDKHQLDVMMHMGEFTDQYAVMLYYRALMILKMRSEQAKNSDDIISHLQAMEQLKLSFGACHTLTDPKMELVRRELFKTTKDTLIILMQKVIPVLTKFELAPPEDLQDKFWRGGMENRGKE